MGQQHPALVHCRQMGASQVLLRTLQGHRPQGPESHEAGSPCHGLVCWLTLHQDPFLSLHTHQVLAFLENSSPSFPKTIMRSCAVGISPQGTRSACVLGKTFWADPDLLATSRSRGPKTRLCDPRVSCQLLLRKGRSKENEGVGAPLSHRITKFPGHHCL